MISAAAALLFGLTAMQICDEEPSELLGRLAKPSDMLCKECNRRKGNR